jgi:hypothetical protein
VSVDRQLALERDLPAAGFELMGDDEFEYPKGHFVRCNDWCLDLFT